jgi:hypothetical protein
MNFTFYRFCYVPTRFWLILSDTDSRPSSLKLRRGLRYATIKKAVGELPCVRFRLREFLSMSAPAVASAIMIALMTAIIIVMTVIVAAITTIKAISAAPRKAKAPFRLCIIHRGGSNINWLRAGVINNGLLINGNGPINVNRLTCGLKREADADFGAAISRY